MTSYPFIEDLFRNILQYSRGIEGRFYMSAKNAIEINSDNLGQVLTDELLEAKKGIKKYPLCIALPPRARGSVELNAFQSYQLTLFFLKTSYYDANGITEPNPKTKTSTHTIPQDWHDMKRCAESFLRVLARLTKANHGLFRLEPGDKLFTTVSTVGGDRASGIRVDFGLQLFTGCDLEDYSEGVIQSIIIPPADSHPAHNL